MTSGRASASAFQAGPAVAGFAHLPSLLFESLKNLPAQDVVVVHHQHAAGPGPTIPRRITPSRSRSTGFTM